MVDSKENYKFDLGVKGLKFSLKLYRCTWHISLSESQVFNLKVIRYCS